MAKLDEAIAAYRKALQEIAREKEPLNWAMVQTNLGVALEAVGRLKEDRELLLDGVSIVRDGLKERDR